MALFGTPSCFASTVDITYTHDNYKQVDDADTLAISTKVMPNNFFESVLGNVQIKNWDIKDSDLSEHGISGDLVGYYNLGKNKQILGVSQLQLADSNLFPKATFYQEFNYKTGDKDNILLGVGGGVQDYYNQDTDTFFKIGPVYYFDGGAVGYKYGKYTDSKSTLNSLFVNYQINDKVQAEGTYNFGNGYWDYNSKYNYQHASVKSSDAHVKLAYQLNDKFALKGGLGRVVIKDKKTDKTALSTNNVSVGLGYNW